MVAPSSPSQPTKTVDTTAWRVPSHPLLTSWRPLIWPARLLFLLSLALYLYSSFESVRLPPPSQLLTTLRFSPAQTETEAPTFLFDWKGNSFTVTPQASYQAQGVLLTHNNVGGIGDIYHDADAVDLKDICITWGESALSGAYSSGTFTSEPWTCVYTPNKGSEPIAFDEFSNNHLLAGTEAIAEKIRRARIGDQVRFAGYLVDYAPSASPDLVRQSSLVRTDTGDGACEVVFVTSFEILKAANVGWRKLESCSFFSACVLGVFLLLSALLIPALEFRLE